MQASSLHVRNHDSETDAVKPAPGTARPRHPEWPPKADPARALAPLTDSTNTIPHVPHSAVIWMNAAQADLVRAVAKAAELDVIAVGSETKGHAPIAAAALSVEPLSDLRTALASADADLFWLADPGDFGNQADDAESILSAARRGLRIAALEPTPASAIDLRAAGWTRGFGDARPIDAITFCPLLRASPSVRDAVELLEPFGDARFAAIECWSRPDECSLGSLLFSAVDLASSLMGELEVAAASYRAPDASPRKPDGLRGLHGDLAAVLRFSGHRYCSLTLSSAAARWNRTVTLLSARGRLRIFDDGFEWIGEDGRKVEESRKRARAEDPPLPFAVEAIASHLRAVLSADHPPIRCDHERTLAAAEAVLLSARTGQGESPSTISHVARVV